MHSRRFPLLEGWRSQPAKRRGKSKARKNNRSRCCRCDDWHLFREYFEDTKKEAFGINSAGNELVKKKEKEDEQS